MPELHLQYYDAVDDEYTWREKELRDFKLIVQKSSILGTNKAPLYRAGVALIYAHWEGFIKKATELYIEYINKSNISVQNLKKNFICLFIQNEARKYNQPYKASIFDTLVSNLITANTTASFPLPKTIETKSNLSYDIFSEILWKAGLNDEEFKIHEYLIDKKLLRNRNEIAHGKYCAIDITQYNKINDKITLILNRYKTIIQNAIVTSAHHVQ